MNERIQELINAGEGRKIEFKTARKALNRDLYETICAFLNRDGGDILLGIKDNGTVQGVDPTRVPQMKRDFVNTINNPQKLNPPCYLSMDEIVHEGMTLLYISVPPSSQVHRCNSRIYDRNEDGDFDITDNQALVTRLYVGKQTLYSENTIYPYADISDLQPDLINHARRLAGARQPGHPWTLMDDRELLNSAQLWQRDYQRGVSGLTLAAILLFGKERTILSVLPHHRTDAILRRDNVDRYDDRDDIRTNLLDSHTRLLAFGEKHLNDPFYLEGDQRISLRSIILREIVGNLLIHREYSQAFPAKLVIEKDKIFTENGNKPHGHGPIDPKLFSPFPKNPAIARVFKEIGWADELGSGVRKLFHYCKVYCGHDPVMVEDDVFRLILPLVGIPSDDEKKTISKKVAGKMAGKMAGKVAGKMAGKILRAMRQNPAITIPELTVQIMVSQRSIERNIKKLQESGRLRRVGPSRGGHWEVLS